jgi:hypothetical protein
MNTDVMDKKPTRSRTSEIAIGNTIYTVVETFEENARETISDQLARFVADRISDDLNRA